MSALRYSLFSGSLGSSDALDVVDADAGDVDLVVLVHGQWRAAGQHEVDRLDAGRAAVVALVGLESQALAELPLLQHEGAGAVRLLRPVALVVLDLRLVDDEGGGAGHLGQEVGLRLVDGDLQREVVDDLDAADLARRAADHVFGADDVAQVGLGDGGGGVRVSGALQGVLEVARGHLAVRLLEDDVLAQVEGVGLAVRASVPALGDVGGELEVFVYA